MTQEVHPCNTKIPVSLEPIKFCRTVIGCYYWNDIPLSIHVKTTKKISKEHFSTIILLRMNHRHSDSRMCVCVCLFMSFSLFLSFDLYIFQSL